MRPLADAPALTAWVAQTLGHTVTLHPLAGGTMGSAYRVDAPGQRNIAALQARHGRGAWTREVDALRRIDGLDGACPRLIAADAKSCALLMTWVDGDDVEPVADAAIWHAAGGLRSRLDAVPAEPDTVPLDHAIAARFAGWLEHARAVLPAATCDEMLAHHDPSVFADRTRRWCHRDFGPHNWRVDRSRSGVRLRFVDLGHARRDDPLVDFVHATVPPFDTPAVIDAFAEGWGVDLDGHTWRCVAQLALLHGLATATWGHIHDAARFRELGAAISARCFVRGSPWCVSR